MLVVLHALDVPHARSTRCPNSNDSAYLLSDSLLGAHFSVPRLNSFQCPTCELISVSHVLDNNNLRSPTFDTLLLPESTPCHSYLPLILTSPLHATAGDLILDGDVDNSHDNPNKILFQDGAEVSANTVLTLEVRVRVTDACIQAKDVLPMEDL